MWSIITKIKNFFIRFFHGAKLSLLSLIAYYHYKKLILFPLMEALLITAAFSGLLAIMFPLMPWIRESQMREYTVGIAITILFFYIVILINVLFKISTVYAVTQYCENNRMFVYTSCLQSFKKIHFIFVWAGLELIVRLLANQKEDDSSADTFLGFVMSTSWQLMSFFIYPIIAFEKVTIFGCLKRSTYLMKKYFGAISGSQLGFQALSKLAPFLILGIISCTRFLLEIMSALTKSTQALSTAHADPKCFILFFLVPYFIFVFMFVFGLITTARTIMSTMLYRHVQGQSTGIFSHNTLESALKSNN